MSNEISKIGSCLLLSIIIIFSSGCLAESAYPAYEYMIEINGLDNYYNNDPTEIFIPVPVMDGVTLFNEEKIQPQLNDWSISLADTEHGKMLLLRTDDHNLTNINVKYSELILQDRSFDQSAKIIKKSMDAPLHPVAEATQSNYSIYEHPDNSMFVLKKNYTSHIIIDNNIKPIAGQNNSIEVRLRYGIFGGMDRGTSGGFYNSEVHEIIPEGINGTIPVKVWVSSTEHNDTGIPDDLYPGSLFYDNISDSPEHPRDKPSNAEYPLVRICLSLTLTR